MFIKDASYYWEYFEYVVRWKFFYNSIEYNWTIAL